MKNVLKITLLLLVLAIAVFALTGCGKKDTNPIVGSWKYDGGSDYTYTFNEDGTGNYASGSSKMDFTYTIKDNKISILYTGNTSPFETEYKIDGDVLNIIDSFGKDTLYKNVK